MNVDKVNATLLRAVNLFREDETRMLRAGTGGSAELQGLQIPLARMAHEIAESTGKPFMTALDAVVEAVSGAAARHFGADVTEEALIEWLGSSNAGAIAQGVAEQL